MSIGGRTTWLNACLLHAAVLLSFAKRGGKEIGLFQI